MRGLGRGQRRAGVLGRRGWLRGTLLARRVETGDRIRAGRDAVRPMQRGEVADPAATEHRAAARQAGGAVRTASRCGPGPEMQECSRN